MLLKDRLINFEFNDQRLLQNTIKKLLNNKFV